MYIPVILGDFDGSPPKCRAFGASGDAQRKRRLVTEREAPLGHPAGERKIMLSNDAFVGRKSRPIDLLRIRIIVLGSQNLNQEARRT